MARRSIWHYEKEFDPARDFVVSKQFMFRGSIAVPGQPFDKSRARPRTLRLLYEQRKLLMSERVVAGSYPPSPSPPPAPVAEATKQGGNKGTIMAKKPVATKGGKKGGGKKK